MDNQASKASVDGAKGISVKDVGRIYRDRTPEGDGYSWSIYGSSAHGFAETLEQAREDWKKAYLAQT